jgi:Flp pilus assembly pilin Flp
MPDSPEQLVVPTAPNAVGRLLGSESGQTLTEYALILTLIAVAVVAAVLLFGGQITSMWSNISDNFPSV